MTFGQRLALNLSPLLLRVGLAFIFIYAGTGKLFYKDMPVSGAPAAWLANNGFIDSSKLPAVGTPLPTPTPTPTPEPAPAAPASDDEPGETTPDAATPDAGSPDDAEPETDAPGEPDDEPAGDTAWRDASSGFATIRVQNGADTDAPGSASADGADDGGRFSAADFAEPIPVARRLGLVLMMHGAAENGNWPAQLSSPTVLGLLSWMAVLTEFVGGWLILLGFLTRLWALGLAGTMVVAMWLTQIAPAIGTDDAFLGFLPALQIDDPALWIKAWQTLELQLILMLAAMAVFFSGPGKVSLDAVLFRRSTDDKPKAAGAGSA